MKKGVKAPEVNRSSESVAETPIVSSSLNNKDKK